MFFTVIKSRRIRWVGLVTRTRYRGNTYRVLVVKPEGKRRLGRHRNERESNVEMDISELG
jgi:hypothetical protein